MIKRKKKILDGIDKEILRLLYISRPLVGSRIAQSVGLSTSAISPRLNNLQEEGIIKPVRTGGIRIFQRTFGDHVRKIKSPRSVYWGLDLLRK